MKEEIHIRADETAACTDYVLNQIGNGAMAMPPPDEIEMFIEDWERENKETLNVHEKQCVCTNLRWVYNDISPKKPPTNKRVMVEDIGKINNDPARNFKTGSKKH